jgi:hypothetical protein
MYKLCFYVPESHVEQVKNAVFLVGGGRVGVYDRCCWQVLGEGEFRPLQGSVPFLGQQGESEKVCEYKVELVCEAECIGAAVIALLDAHPYEQPAWDAVLLATELSHL